MEFKIQDLNNEDLGNLKEKWARVCREYEPWADMMMLGGGGDPGSLPFDMDEIESIHISVKGVGTDCQCERTMELPTSEEGKNL